MCLLSISLLKGSPFFGGFSQHSNPLQHSQQSAGKTCHLGTCKLNSRCLLISWYIKHISNKIINSYFFRHRTPFRPKSNSDGFYLQVMKGFESGWVGSGNSFPWKNWETRTQKWTIPNVKDVPCKSCGVNRMYSQSRKLTTIKHKCYDLVIYAVHPKANIL